MKVRAALILALVAKAQLAGDLGGLRGAPQAPRTSQLANPTDSYAATGAGVRLRKSRPKPVIDSVWPSRRSVIQMLA